jgi:A/G-specific adenine glycosylase
MGARAKDRMPKKLPAEPASSQQRLTSPWKQRLRRRLLAWYARHARNLPWRETRDPYHVWISEIMLQQTQVTTVESYFVRFVTTFPTLHDLAKANEEEVLRLWEGLGYYRRARQMHAAARTIVQDYNGRFPEDAATLSQLPGIGRYTAGAISSIAMGQREPILETNTIRLLSRLVGYREDPTKAAGQRLLWKTAAEILPRSGVADFNQALMELGSLICTPTAPGCNRCPVARLCWAQQAGQQHQIPPVKKKGPITQLHETAVVVNKNGTILMRRCAEGQRWARLWDFPRVEVHSSHQSAARRELAAKVHQQTGIHIAPGNLLKTIHHAVTRYRITLDCYQAAYVTGRVRGGQERPVRWIRQRDLEQLPLSATGRILVRMIA